ncbi:hypothetical protein BXZ70DRAFT_286355 [Cristinia sonorae]|uniref:Ribonuclease H1 N-terminal domain-containing protein n=1 Tax=Cristinia sonorae TaxID=1940300 RepID=A0A8K0UZ60_9AGAR|nr:hypothetical protein BXZ70DRAFT_286355 [Cristinia sonorae]
MAKKKAAYVVSVGLSPGVYTNWLDAAPQVLNVPGSIYKGYSTLAEAQTAFGEQRLRGRVKVIRAGNSSDDSDDLPSRHAVPAQRAQPVRRDPTAGSVASPTLTRAPMPTTQRSSPQSSTLRRRYASELSSPATGVTVELSEQLSHISISPSSSRRSEITQSPTSPSVASQSRSARRAHQNIVFALSSPMTDQTQVLSSSRTSSTPNARVPPPTKVARGEESGHTPRSSRHHTEFQSPLSPQVSSPSVASTRVSTRQSDDSRIHSSRSNYMSLDETRSVRSRASARSATHPSVGIHRDVANGRGRSSTASSPATDVTIAEPSMEGSILSTSSPSLYPATTASFHTFNNTTTSSHSALSPSQRSTMPEIMDVSESSEDEAERPWSPATNVTYEEPGSPDFHSTPVPMFEESEQENNDGEHGYATAPSSPRSSIEEIESISGSPAFVSTPISSTLSPRIAYTPSTPSSSVYYSHSRANSTSVVSASSSSSAARSAQTTHIEVRRVFSEAQVQTSPRPAQTPPIRRMATSQAQVQTGSPQQPSHRHVAGYCRECHQPLQPPRQVVPGTGRSGDVTVPASPILPPAKSLRGSEREREQDLGGFSVNALGLTQSEYLAVGTSPMYDPRSPLGRSTSLPAGAVGFGRPSPTLYDGRIQTVVRR